MKETIIEVKFVQLRVNPQGRMLSSLLYIQYIILMQYKLISFINIRLNMDIRGIRIPGG